VVIIPKGAGYMTSLPLMADLATSHGPGHPSTQVTQSPLIGHGSVLFFVRVAGLALYFE
jgi:hypothetical protein